MAFFGFLKNNDEAPALAELPVSRIMPNPNGPRRVFDEAAIAELASSIASAGLIRPLIVRRVGARYELVSGERRLRAVKKLGKKRVLCIVDGGAGRSGSRQAAAHSAASNRSELSARSALAALAALIENLQRAPLDIFEEAECCLKLMNRLNIGADELAERMGRSRDFIENRLRLLWLEPGVRELIRRFALGERHALAALRLDETADRLELIRRAGELGLDAEATERLADAMRGGRDAYARALHQMQAAQQAQNPPVTRDERGQAQTAQEVQEVRTAQQVQTGAGPRRVVRLVRDYRIFVNTVSIACEQLRSGGLKVDMDRKDREDGLELVISVTREKFSE